MSLPQSRLRQRQHRELTAMRAHARLAGTIARRDTFVQWFRSSLGGIMDADRL
ncbi:MAG TPA: hypothetical protein VFR95_13450 [Gemmatimonadaceae bacterium]|nr:hypothetical protein [Gemmatimonadaceae bacterium]